MIKFEMKKCNQATGSRSVRTEMVKEVEEDLKKDIMREREREKSESQRLSEDRMREKGENLPI